jgi:NAD(P)-dependent dehydrogenase (short-subunit alcohol dehydrogenase family)
MGFQGIASKGIVVTGAARGIGAAAREAFQAGVPLGRYSMPEEQASLATWLLSDESGYATGGGFPLDGGIGAGPYSR